MCTNELSRWKHLFTYLNFERICANGVTMKSSLEAEKDTLLLDGSFGDITSPILEEESCLYKKDPLLCLIWDDKMDFPKLCWKIGFDWTGVGLGQLLRFFVLSFLSLPFLLLGSVLTFDTSFVRSLSLVSFVDSLRSRSLDDLLGNILQKHWINST